MVVPNDGLSPNHAHPTEMKQLIFALLLLTVSLKAQIRPVPGAAPDTITTYWQTKDHKEPTAQEVLLKVTIYNLARLKMAGVEVLVRQTESGTVWRGVTGSYGEVLFLVPKGKEYRIGTAEEPAIQTVQLSNERFARENIGITYLPNRFTEEARHDSVFQTVSPAQTPTRSRILVVLTILDLDDQALDGEEMYFVAQKTGKVYVGKTNRSGKAYLMLPMGDSYCVSTRMEANLKCYDMPRDDRAGQLNIRYNTIGTREMLRRQAERARLAHLRDSLYEADRIRDSIAGARMAARGPQMGQPFIHQLLFGNPGDAVKKRIEQRAAAERDSVARDPKYFEKTGEVVQATLYRMRDRWKHKVIVTDLTGSMTPYMDQVVLWHALQLVQGEENRYVFFNDGDRKADSAKMIGQTGGIYGTDRSNMDSLLNVMVRTARAGDGGDSPENDLEALLEGARRKRGLDELILIADNFSDVRDMDLLIRLQVPVHIILCGADHGVNENYLEIACKTGGSIHTIEQDIEGLARLADGATITIGGYQYRVNRGKFIQISRM